MSRFSMAELYSRHPLKQPNEIRLLSLLPSSSLKAEVKCELQTVVLSSITTRDGATDYTTLSYTWGYPDNPKSILIDGHQFQIGQNLYSALQHLRLRDAPLRLWVDAICINQSDTAERNQQVQMMREIYATSCETIIYLGAEDGSEACFNAWNFLEYRDPENLNIRDASQMNKLNHASKKVNFKAGYCDVLEAVTTRDWFSRIWVLQEFVVANVVSIQCGARKTSWENFARTSFTYFNLDQVEDRMLLKSRRNIINQLRILGQGSTSRAVRPSWKTILEEHPDWQQRIQPIKEMCQTRLLYQKSHSTSDVFIPDWILNDPLAQFIRDDTEFRQGSLRLFSLLSRSRRFNSTDARDKFIALLGICKRDSHPKIDSLVDYTKTTPQIYRDVTRMIIEDDGTLDILCQSGQQVLIEDYTFSSWAGRWDSALIPPISILSRLGTESNDETRDRKVVVKKHHTWSLDETILYCTGGMMGTLVAIGDLDISLDTKELGKEGHARKMTDIERVHCFDRCAYSLLPNTPWLSFPDTTSPDGSFSSYEISIERTGGGFWGGWNVTITSTEDSQPEELEQEDSIPRKWSQRYVMFGGAGFIGDVEALQQGRKLGLMRCQSDLKDTNGGVRKATYVFGVVPERAQVGDMIVSFTGAKTLFLVYPDPEASTNSNEEEEVRYAQGKEDLRVREVLPKNKTNDAQMMHCRIRGECRFTAFEDTWGLVDKMPLMAYIGYLPPEWRDRIFAIH